MSDISHANDICRMDAVQLADSIRKKHLSPVEVVDAVFARMDTPEPELHAFCTPTPDMARAGAQRLEAEIMAGRETGRLAGGLVGVPRLRTRGG